MYDIGDIKGNHFCILIFPQGKWPKNYDETIFRKIQAEWFKMEDATGSIEKDPIINPKKLGKKLKDCKICSAVYEVFKKQQGADKGLILFSHFVPLEADFKSLLNLLMDDPQIQKIYYLEQNSAFYMVPPDQFIAKVKSNARERVSIAEFIRMVDFGRFETGVRYEIFRQSTY